ncbi:MAG: nuclear transport factor 2 family protein [Rhodopila sp.]
MHPVNQIVANYIAAWNETHADRRRNLIAQTWSDGGGYIDAHREGEGHTGIDAMIAGVQQVFAGYRFRLCSKIETHHDTVRFSWQAGGTDGAPLFFAGTDFAMLAPDGRFRTVTGFVDAMPAVA